jgi:hypothetical protein
VGGSEREICEGMGGRDVSEVKKQEVMPETQNGCEDAADICFSACPHPPTKSRKVCSPFQP